MAIAPVLWDRDARCWTGAMRAYENAPYTMLWENKGKGEDWSY